MLNFQGVQHRTIPFAHQKLRDGRRKRCTRWPKESGWSSRGRGMNFWDDERRKHCQGKNNLKHSILEILDMKWLKCLKRKRSIQIQIMRFLQDWSINISVWFRVCHCNRRLKQSPEVFKPSLVTSTTALAIPCRWHRPAKWCKVLQAVLRMGSQGNATSFCSPRLGL